MIHTYQLIIIILTPAYIDFIRTVSFRLHVMNGNLKYNSIFNPHATINTYCKSTIDTAKWFMPGPDQNGGMVEMVVFRFISRPFEN